MRGDGARVTQCRGYINIVVESGGIENGYFTFYMGKVV